MWQGRVPCAPTGAMDANPTLPQGVWELTVFQTVSSTIEIPFSSVITIVSVHFFIMLFVFKFPITLKKSVCFFFHPLEVGTDFEV